MPSRLLKPLALLSAFAIALGSSSAAYAAIAVIDRANLVQAIQQVVHDITKIKNQIQQIAQMQSHLSSINGTRGLGRVFDSPVLRNYVPSEAFTVINAVDTSGYGGLNATAKSLRDAAMVYNCLDRSDLDRAACQAALAQPYQHKGLLQDAMSAAAGRLVQINGLMDQINATNDQKSIQEIQARIGAENAMLAHEMSQVQMLQGMADSEERIARSKERERQYQMLARTGRIADYLP